MKKRFEITLVVLVLAVAALACNAVSLPGMNGPLMEDNFDGLRQNWGTGSDSNSSVEYENGGLRFRVFVPRFYVWSNPGDSEYSNTHIEVTARDNSSDSNTAFGIICYQGEPDTNLYYFAITSYGQYVIARGEDGKDDFFLTNDNEWGDSELIVQDAASYRIGADCGNGVLTLYVDGKQIDSVQDSTYSGGYVGLFTWSDKQENAADVTFDDFVITRLPSP
jgi:hypothetical protein